MPNTSHASHRIVRWIAAFALLVANVGCQPSTGKTTSTSEKPATIEKLPLEIDLATVTLSADAFRRLGIETQAVEFRQVSPRRTLGGEATIPLGKSLVVTAPVTGLVARPESGAIPLPGTRVEQSGAVLTLIPLLSPERNAPTPAEQVQMIGARANLEAALTVARGDVERSRAEVDAAQITLGRAKQLFEDRAGARRAVDDATAQLEIADAMQQAATQREQQLSKLLDYLAADAPAGEASPLPLSAPISGIVSRLGVSEGQTVAGGALLFEIVSLETIWIRVPVFVDLLSSIQTDQPAHLVALSGEPLGAQADSDSGSGMQAVAASPVEARPIAAPPSADALTSSADLYYEIDNRTLGLRPGQRIGVELPLVGDREALAVPSSAILYDIHGNSWVYVVTGEREFTRQRVSIRWTQGTDAILESGPEVGSQVVVAGAAELFGTEFGTGK